MLAAFAQQLEQDGRTEEWQVRQAVRSVALFQKHYLRAAVDSARAFLSDLAIQRHVAASTQNQAFNALLFLLREVLGQEVKGLDAVRAKRGPHLPVVLSEAEVKPLWCIPFEHPTDVGRLRHALTDRGLRADFRGGTTGVNGWNAKEKPRKPLDFRGFWKMVVGLGFEPRKALPADLQSAPVGHFGIPPEFVSRRLSAARDALNYLKYRPVLSTASFTVDQAEIERDRFHAKGRGQRLALEPFHHGAQESGRLPRSHEIRGQCQVDGLRPDASQDDRPLTSIGPQQAAVIELQSKRSHNSRIE